MNEENAKKQMGDIGEIADDDEEEDDYIDDDEYDDEEDGNDDDVEEEGREEKERKGKGSGERRGRGQRRKRIENQGRGELDLANPEKTEESPTCGLYELLYLVGLEDKPPRRDATIGHQLSLLKAAQSGDVHGQGPLSRYELRPPRAVRRLREGYQGRSAGIRESEATIFVSR